MLNAWSRESCLHVESLASLTEMIHALAGFTISTCDASPDISKACFTSVTTCVAASSNVRGENTFWEIVLVCHTSASMESAFLREAGGQGGRTLQTLSFSVSVSEKISGKDCSSSSEASVLASAHDDTRGEWSHSSCFTVPFMVMRKPAGSDDERRDADPSGSSCSQTSKNVFLIIKSLGRVMPFE